MSKTQDLTPWLSQKIYSCASNRSMARRCTCPRNFTLKPGTAIATFIKGPYPSYATGNHAAFYCGQDASGIWVIDQSSKRQKIQRRKISFRGNIGGNQRVNDGDAYSVIE